MQDLCVRFPPFNCMVVSCLEVIISIANVILQIYVVRFSQQARINYL